MEYLCPSFLSQEIERIKSTRKRPTSQDDVAFHSMTWLYNPQRRACTVLRFLLASAYRHMLPHSFRIGMGLAGTR